MFTWKATSKDREKPHRLSPSSRPVRKSDHIGWKFVVGQDRLGCWCNEKKSKVWSRHVQPGGERGGVKGSINKTEINFLSCLMPATTLGEKLSKTRAPQRHVRDRWPNRNQTQSLGSPRSNLDIMDTWLIRLAFMSLGHGSFGSSRTGSPTTNHWSSCSWFTQRVRCSH